MSVSAYFAGIIEEERVLRDHGFESWPTEAETVYYLMDISDRIDAVCKSIGVETRKDVRGRWQVVSLPEEAV